MLARALVIGLLGLASACARTLPPKPGTAALYRDLQRLVTVAEAADWKIDRLEIEDMLPNALLSTCRVADDTRKGLAAWLDDRIAALGGPVDIAYRQRGRDLDRVAELLELSRIRSLLAATEVARGDCPFWIRPKATFAGRQISDDRWQLSVGGGGRGNAVLQGGNRDVSFGGAGRLVFGRALGDRWAVYSGVESGASALFPKDEVGERQSVVVLFELAVPVVARLRFVNSYVEVEGGYLATFEEDDFDADHGFRVGVAVGARALLTRVFFPGAAFQLSYDRVAVSEPSAPARHTIRLGFRVALDMNLGGD